MSICWQEGNALVLNTLTQLLQDSKENRSQWVCSVQEGQGPATVTNQSFPLWTFFSKAQLVNSCGNQQNISTGLLVGEVIYCLLY